MDKQALKNILYGSLYELALDKKYYYHSKFDTKYSHFTPEGEKAVVEILTIWVDRLLKEEDSSLNKRAKDMVLKGLKDNENE